MTHLSLSDVADRIGEVFPLVIRGFIKRQANELCRGKITMPQFIILDCLHRQGETRMTDLAKFMGVTTPAMTGIVERLVKYQYAERVFDPDDRRIIKIKVTAKGSSLVKRITRQRHQMITDIFGKLSFKDREDYLRIITRIRDILKAQEQVSPGGS